MSGEVTNCHKPDLSMFILQTKGPVIPRCLLEEKSAFVTEFAVLGSRNNFTPFVPHCAQDHSFSSHQEWPALGLSWQVNGEGRMVTKCRPKRPLKKGETISHSYWVDRNGTVFSTSPPSLIRATKKSKEERGFLKRKGNLLQTLEINPLREPKARTKIQQNTTSL